MTGHEFPGIGETDQREKAYLGQTDALGTQPCRHQLNQQV
jgi:hypothetical protein